VTLVFQAIDERELPNDRSGFSVLIGGSPATYVSENTPMGPNRQYRYVWTVPNGITASSIGYSITVADVAGNLRTTSAESFMALGKNTLCCAYACCTGHFELAMSVLCLLQALFDS